MDKENQKKQSPAFIYEGKMKHNIDAAREKVRDEKKYRIAMLVATTALTVMLVGMILIIVNVSRNLRNNSIQVRQDAATVQTDTIGRSGSTEK